MRSFIITTIFLLAIAWLGYQGFQTFAQSPNALTQQTASTIIKYPNSQDWQIKNRRNVCFFTTEECLQPTKVSFQSDNDWNQIYFFYKERMVQKGWDTKSIIVTSIPAGITFTNATRCKVYLTQPKPLVNFSSKSPNNKYSFSVTCPNQQ